MNSTQRPRDGQERRFRAARATRVVVGLVLVLGAVPKTQGLPMPVVGSSLAEGEFEANVRRWESVIQVHVAMSVGDPIGRAELAALDAGGAVLDRVKTEGGGGPTSIYRLLIRTRSQEGLQQVMQALRRVRGVLAVNVAQLPETASYPGSPSFISSYTGEFGRETGGPRVVTHHEVPEVLDKRDLLESTPIPGASVNPELGTGGFTLNVSEVIKRMKQSHWRKREDRMKNAYLPILPPSGS